MISELMFTRKVRKIDKFWVKRKGEKGSLKEGQEVRFVEDGKKGWKDLKGKKAYGVIIYC